MSYKVNARKEFLNEFFARLSDFNNIKNRLLLSKTKDEFEVWFEKLELIDKRSLYLLICNNKDRIEKDYLDMVSDRFIKMRL